MKEYPKDNNIIFVVCVAVLAGILSFSLYLPSLKTPFLFDDLLIINPATEYSAGIRALLENINIFSSRPLLEATYRLNSAVSGANPEGYHFINIFIHFMNSLMLFFIIRILLLTTAKKPDIITVNIISLTSIIFFLVHPLASEAVIYITGRSSLLYTFFILLSFYFFLKAIELSGKKTFICLIPSLLFFICALASKEIALIYPAILLTTLLFFSFEKRKKRSIMLFLPYPLIALFLIIFKMSFLFTLTSPDKTARPLSTQIFTEFYVFAHSFMKILFPINLNFDPYFNDISSFLDFRFFAGFSLLIIMIVLAIYFKEKAALTTFGILWFLISFSPHIVIRLRDYMSERWLYFPLTALPFIVAGIGKIFFQRGKKTSNSVLLIVLLLCTSTCLFAVIINNRLSDWQSDISIWEDTVKKSPEKFRVHANLGFVLLKKNRFEESEKEIKKAIAINSQYAEIHYYLAEVYMGINDEENAFKEFTESLKYLPYYDYANNPVYYNALINIGVIYFKEEKKQKAMDAFIAAINENPERSQAYNNIGILYMSIGDLKTAEQSFLTALSKDSKNINAKQNLEDVYRKRGE